MGVMQEAILEAKSVMAAINSKKKKKKKKSENGLEVSALEESVINGNGTETEADKTMDMTVDDASNGVEKKKKKKKKKAAEGDESVVEAETNGKANKKKHSEADTTLDQSAWKKLTPRRPRNRKKKKNAE